MSDSNVEAVREKLRERSETGLRKYGVTTERTDLTRKQWLIHAQEEALDLAVYLQRLISDEGEREEESELIEAYRESHPEYDKFDIAVSRATNGGPSRFRMTPKKVSTVVTK